MRLHRYFVDAQCFESEGWADLIPLLVACLKPFLVAARLDFREDDTSGWSEQQQRALARLRERGVAIERDGVVFEVVESPVFRDEFDHICILLPAQRTFELYGRRDVPLVSASPGSIDLILNAAHVDAITQCPRIAPHIRRSS